ncbi:hypothetical protein AUEXF2481DRAFT_418856 [Aureobasidium subglaciale EXF-2481]|uniref:Uncharacterized protein n=1 Tax=Aureobasidium subglaciale (strain EXF-2481) TaxID=1043005 RepID=A0A074Y3R3_AURSE|nr:uncharacterized protein AUEXF2481DRAFT_418856 [Aureobasidium subglaciale EXF-2481]KEQ92433.1 hypothetical protein AUEXF2481DRAFT_418856 [Aureobasidium subglaciale EXF-2481]
MARSGIAGGLPNLLESLAFLITLNDTEAVHLFLLQKYLQMWSLNLRSLRLSKHFAQTAKFTGIKPTSAHALVLCLKISSPLHAPKNV